MTRIFDMILVKPCNLRPFYNPGVQPPQCHNHLLHICSRWREILLLNSVLWSHIDLAPGPSKSHLSRANFQIDWASVLPLDIHITDVGMTEYYYDYELFQFLSLVAGRMKTLEFDITAVDLELFHRVVFDNLFSGCSANFTKLTLILHHAETNLCIGATSSSDSDDDGFNDLHGITPSSEKSRPKFDDNLVGLKVLHLQGLFPTWESKAYHGLVDLRLTASGPNWLLIEELEFENILKSSPELKILHLALYFKYSVHPRQHINPVRLKDLEVINLSTSLDYDSDDSALQIANILRLLAPGSRPLRLSLDINFYEEPLLTELGQFLSRSSVTHLCTRGGYLPMGEPLCYGTNLKILVFNSCFYNIGYDLPLADQVNSAPPSSSLSHLHSWYIRNSDMNSRDLRSLVNLYPNGTLVLSECRFVDHEGRPENISEAELSTSFPTVKFIPRTNPLPDPTADWDLLQY
ncbi:hypothetical protein B0J17DRAFT_678333 [Rhizoctonia solani]|nr:hypothetical protein B0J17DRAFT_678333 [Rhizoctonia solani]